MKYAFIWDLDGTLLDSYRVIVSSAVRTAAEAGIRDDKEAVLRKLKQQSLTAYLRDVSLRCGTPCAALLVRYREISHETTDQIPLIPGAREALERLAGCGADHFVYTHRGSSSEPILRRLGILSFFREVVTSEYGFAPKPSGEGVRYLLARYGLDPRFSWYVGDRTLDVLCGKDAGIRTLLYLPEGSPVQATGQEDLILRDWSAESIEKMSHGDGSH